MNWAWKIILLSLIVVGIVKADSPVNLTFSYQGKTTTVQGIQHANGKTFHSLPYAAPPVGELRFAPAKAEALPSFVDARNERPFCAQQNLGSSKEDCLYLDIYTPLNATPVSPVPVYVYIHGGSFVFKGASLFPGLFDNLVNRGPIIVASINYRLGPFGFFSTRDSVVPGNMGMTDWIVALQWIQNYIRFFGGDPTKVTIGGESAGGVAVSTLTLTRKADSL